MYFWWIATWMIQNSFQTPNSLTLSVQISTVVCLWQELSHFRIVLNLAFSFLSTYSYLKVSDPNHLLISSWVVLDSWLCQKYLGVNGRNKIEIGSMMSLSKSLAFILIVPPYMNRHFRNQQKDDGVFLYSNIVTV